MDMPDLDLKKLGKNKLALAGVGVAAAFGLFVLLRRGHAGGDGGDVAGEGTSASAAYTPGLFDSTGTDLAATLGEFQRSQQVALDQYAAQLNNTLDAINNQKGGGTGVGSTPNSPVITRGGAHLGLGTHYIGNLHDGKTYALRDVAARFAKNPGDKNEVQSWLVRIVNQNPTLRGKTSITGGTKIVVN